MDPLVSQFEGIEPGSKSTLQLAPGKLLYQVFPKDGIDLSNTAEFIKETIGSDILSPWTDVNDKLMHWTIEASPENVSQIQGNPNIAHVDEIKIPALPADTLTLRDISSTERRAAPQEPVEEYLVFARDGKNNEETKQTEEFLQNLLGKDNVDKPFWWKEALRYWVCTMSTAQREEVAARPSVEAVEHNAEGGYGRHTSRHELPVLQSSAAKLLIAKAKRAITYSIQTDAVVELVEVSQPKTVQNLKDLKNYVYDSNSGVGTFVYHVEGGVAFKQQADEFPNVVPENEHLQTERAKNRLYFGQPIKPWDDPISDSHGTCTADKAVGKEFGVSKKAKLVVVQLDKITPAEVNDALSLITEDILAKPDRRKKSVITMSMFLGKTMLGFKDQTLLKDVIQTLFNLDVPIVICAGNEAETPGREDVDTFPALFADQKFPLIVVGSTDHGGALSSFSQRGPHVTLHAPGRDITCLLSISKRPVHDKSGTSYAAPLVAGQIANLLSNPPPELDTTVNGAVVQNVWNYLRSDYGSWERFPGIRVVWNGVTERDNPKSQNLPPAPAPAPAPVPESSPVKRCHGLGTKKFIERQGLADLIAKKFCPDVVSRGNDPGSGSIVRRYNHGTSEEISLSLDMSPGTPRPTQDHCVKSLLEITDGCDIPNNPQNFKAGGSYAIKDQTYHIDPKAERKPASGDGKGGDCDTTWNAAYNDNTVWGRGWEGANWGAKLKKEVEGCVLMPNTWSFSYGLGKDDDREWTAKFRTGALQRGCTTHAGRTASGWKGFGCSGTG